MILPRLGSSHPKMLIDKNHYFLYIYLLPNSLQQQKIAEQKSAKAQQAALKKHDALVERLNKKFLKQGSGPDDHNAP